VLSVALATIALAAAAAWATTTTQSASGGGVTATLTLIGTAPQIEDMRLKIVRSGRVRYDQPVSSRLCGRLCEPGGFGARASSVRVIDLERIRRPDVILELYSGGADCCFVDQVLSFDPGAGTYVRSEHDFFYAGADIKKLGSKWRFVSADGAFVCAFTDCADSGEPLQIWRFGMQRFVDTTRSYPQLITANAAKWLRLFRRHRSNGVGLIAAWAADEELLGHNPLVQSTLAAAAAKGTLRDGGLGQATGTRFVAELNRLLRKLGYER
jgi:hypothetical protein